MSKSSVSREYVEASEAKLKTLCERRFDDVDILVVYVDGIVLGKYHVIAAVGIDIEGHDGPLPPSSKSRNASDGSWVIETCGRSKRFLTRNKLTKKRGPR